MSLDCFIVMSTLEMLKKPLCDDDAQHVFKRVYYGCSHILRFSFWADGLIGVWVGDQKVSHLELGINWMRSIFSSHSPENLPSRLLYHTIKTQHLELCIKGNPPYLGVCAPNPSMITSF